MWSSIPILRKTELVGDLQAEGRDPRGVPVGVRVAGVDGPGERLDRGKVGVFQRLGLFLKADRHEVEDLAQISDLVRGSGRSSLGQVSGSNRSHRTDEPLNRPGDRSRQHQPNHQCDQGRRGEEDQKEEAKLIEPGLQLRGVEGDGEVAEPHLTHRPVAEQVHVRLAARDLAEWHRPIGLDRAPCCRGQSDARRQRR